VPCAVTIFPADIDRPPREWAERAYNLARWTVMPRGGHFAAAEEPELLAEDIRAFFRPLRA
jgi:pimeloyl-ACP methyl ester carboxylesterase